MQHSAEKHKLLALLYIFSWCDYISLFRSTREAESMLKVYLSFKGTLMFAEVTRQQVDLTQETTKEQESIYVTKLVYR